MESRRFRVVSNLRKNNKIREGERSEEKGPKATNLKIPPSLSINLFQTPLNLYARGYEKILSFIAEFRSDN